MMEHFNKTWSTGKGNGKLLQYSFLENSMNIMKRQKEMTLKDEAPSTVGVQNTTGEEQRNEDAEPKWKRHSTVVISGNESKVLCCKEHYCIGT